MGLFFHFLDLSCGVRGPSRVTTLKCEDVSPHLPMASVASTAFTEMPRFAEESGLFCTFRCDGAAVRKLWKPRRSAIAPRIAARDCPDSGESPSPREVPGWSASIDRRGAAARADFQPCCFGPIRRRDALVQLALALLMVPERREVLVAQHRGHPHIRIRDGRDAYFLLGALRLEVCIIP